MSKSRPRDQQSDLSCVPCLSDTIPLRPILIRQCVEDLAWAQRLAQERQHEAQERKEALERFLTRHGFAGINEPRRNGCTFLGATKTYPLHCAAELGDAGVVEMLLKEGAMPSQKNSSGKTALQLAQKKGRAGSHDTVLRLLAGSCSQPLAGGA